MKLLVATQFIALATASSIVSASPAFAAKKEPSVSTETTKLPVVSEYFREKARGTSDEDLVKNLTVLAIEYGHMTPTHVIDELVARAMNPEKFESILSLFTAERERNNASTYFKAPRYFKETNLTILALKEPVPSELNEAGVEKSYKSACTGLTVQDCFKFTTNLVEKNYVNFTSNAIAELIVANSGKLGTANQEIASHVLLKMSQHFATLDPVSADILKVIPVFRELARFDGPGNGRTAPGMKNPASYQDKGAAQLKVRDQLLQLAFEKDSVETVRFCSAGLISDFEAIATGTPGSISKTTIAGLIAEQKPLITLFVKNADESQYTEFKSRLESISQTSTPNESPLAPRWRAKAYQWWIAAIEAARATH